MSTEAQLSIQGTFSTELSGGYGSASNPQFSFSVSHDGEYSITVQVEWSTAMGIIFWVNENRTGNRLLSLTSNDNPEVVRSSYLITKSRK